MNYQDIPFLIWAEKLEISQQISKILGRKANTYIESSSSDSVDKFLEKTENFTCNVFHYQKDSVALNDLIKSSMRKRPYSAMVLFSFSDIPYSLYQKFVRNGVSDVLVYYGDNSQIALIECLLKTLNQKWKAYRYFEKERKKMFDATVVTAYHEINQPLTVILNSIGLFRMEMKSQQVSAEKINRLLGFLIKSTDRIQEILDQLKEIRNPELKEYSKGVPMVKLDAPQKIEGQEQISNKDNEI
jgi:hypothetical protein